jgi:hypothetical protein
MVEAIRLEDPQRTVEEEEDSVCLYTDSILSTTYNTLKFILLFFVSGKYFSSWQSHTVSPGSKQVTAALKFNIKRTASSGLLLEDPNQCLHFCK